MFAACTQHTRITQATRSTHAYITHATRSTRDHLIINIIYLNNYIAGKDIFNKAVSLENGEWKQLYIQCFGPCDIGFSRMLSTSFPLLYLYSLNYSLSFQDYRGRGSATDPSIRTWRKQMNKRSGTTPYKGTISSTFGRSAFYHSTTI